MAHLLGDNWFNVWRWFTHGDPTRTGQISEYDHSTKNLVFCKVQFTYPVPLLILIIVRIMHRRFWHDRTGLQRPCSWPCFINALRITKQRDQEFAIYTENYNNILNLFLLLPSVPFLHEVTGLASCATFKIQVNSSSIKTQYICAMNSIVHVAHRSTWTDWWTSGGQNQKGHEPTGPCISDLMLNWKHYKSIFIITFLVTHWRKWSYSRWALNEL